MTCRICGEEHDRHEDAACGCGCGSEPMGCGPCMNSGGPTTASAAGAHPTYDPNDPETWGGPDDEEDW